MNEKPATQRERRSRRAFLKTSGAGFALGTATFAEQRSQGSKGTSNGIPSSQRTESVASAAPRATQLNKGFVADSLRLAPDSGEFLAIYPDALQVRVHSEWTVESDGQSEPVPVNRTGSPHDKSIPCTGLAWKETAVTPPLVLEYSWWSGSQLECSIRVSNQGNTPQTLCLVQRIYGFPLDGACFAPSLKSSYDPKKSRLAFGYRGAPDLKEGDSGGAVCIPMVCLYDERRDLGFTLAAHISSPTPPFFCEVQPAADHVVARRRIRLGPNESTTIRQHIVRHEGCWRPGLRWVRETFPEYFMLPEDKVKATHGCFIYTNTADEALCDEFAAAGVKNVEVHYTVPFFGKSVPEEEPWVKMLDDKWNTIKLTTDPAAPREDAPYREIGSYVSRVTKPSGTRADVRKFLRNLRARSIRSYMYLNPTESWEFFALQEFPECVLKNADGSPRMTWFDHVQMDCRPEARWGQYMLEEVRRLLDLYPEADGIFVDQSASDSAGNSITRLTTAVAGLAREKGKDCYWNGPYMVDLMEHAVGLLGELGPVGGEQIKWLTIGNKVCCGLGHSEAQYQRNLLNGLWPPAPSQIHSRSFRVSDNPAHCKPIPEELARLHRSYMYLYELYPGKTWFLGPNPLDVPPGTQGNIFENPRGGYLLSVVVPGQNIADAPRVRQASVTVRVPDAGRIRSVSLRTANLPGRAFRIPFRLDGGSLLLQIPWLGSASLLQLAYFDTPDRAEMPEPAGKPSQNDETRIKVVHASIRAQGVVRAGNLDSIRNGLVTSAPLPRVPRRRTYLNGRVIGELQSVNSRHWHSHVFVGTLNGVTVDVTDILRQKNEFVIEPDGPEDFFKIRNIAMTVVFSDGRIIHSTPGKQTYSSCPHAEAEGTIGAPIRVPIEFRKEDGLPE